jgi:hypothetical protein
MTRSVIPAISVTLLLCACGSSSSSALSTPSPQLAGTVTETLSDCSLSQASDRILAGNLILKFENKTGVEAGFDLWPVREGRTYADVIAFIAEERKLAAAGEPGRGHLEFFPYSDPSLQMPLSSAPTGTASGRLDAGTYTVVCVRFFAEASEARPLGVTSPLTIVGS